MNSATVWNEHIDAVAEFRYNLADSALFDEYCLPDVEDLANVMKKIIINKTKDDNSAEC